MRYVIQVWSRNVALDIVGPADKALWEVSQMNLAQEGRDFEGMYFGQGRSAAEATARAIDYLRKSVAHAHIAKDVEEGLRVATAADPTFEVYQDSVAYMYCQLLIGKPNETTP